MRPSDCWRSMYTRDSGSTWNTPSVRYLSMEALMSAMYSSTLGAFRLASGRISRRVDGASPTVCSTACQYSGSDVNWSQATTAHLVMS